MATGAHVVIPYVVNFSVVVVLLFVLLRKPVKKFVYQRHERIKDSIESAKIAQLKAVERNHAAKLLVSALASQEKDIFEKEKRGAEEDVAAIFLKAKEEMARIHSEADRLSAAEQEETSDRIKGQFLDLVLNEAEEGLKKGLKKDDHIAIVKRAQNSIEVGV